MLLAISGLIWKGIPRFHGKSPTPGSSKSLGQEQLSIVVLPFDDLSPGRDNEYFAEGLSDKIIGDLSQIRALRVISRTTATVIKETRRALRATAEEVKVRYMLEGNVARAGNTLRISARLIDAASDTQLWVGQYPGTLDDVFNIQEKVSRAIVGGLKLTPAEERQIARRPVRSGRGYIWVRPCALRCVQ